MEMNNRIRKLAEQAGIEFDDDFPLEPETIYYYKLSDFEKFAELIIRECAEVCMKEIDNGWAMAPKSPWMAKQILEHFGVE